MLYCSRRACKADVFHHLKYPEGTNKVMQEGKKQEELCQREETGGVVPLLARVDANAEFLPEI